LVPVAQCVGADHALHIVEDGGVVETDLVMVYAVHDDGRVASMRAFWEPERAMATYRKPG
jgi:steroid Delta-isomerase